MAFYTGDPLRKFLFSLVLVTTSVVAIGWYTNVFKVMNSLWIALSIGAFLPVLILLVVILGLLFTFFVLLPLSFLLGSLPDVSEPVEAAAWAVGLIAETGTETGVEMLASPKARGFFHKFFAKYYGFLGQIKHPIFWGMTTGLGSGLILLSITVYPIIVRKEVATADILAATQSNLYRYFLEHGHYPAPNSEGHLSLPINDLKGAPDAVVLDGFGRPFEYRMLSLDPLPDADPESKTKPTLLETLKGKIIEKVSKRRGNDQETGALESYTLHSYGYDLQDGNDDVCVSVSSPRLDALEAKKASSLTNFLKVAFKVKSIKKLRCGEP